MRYKNIKQHRLKGYDYSSNEYYYVTICTKNNFFGEVVDGKMKLSGIGEVARDFWLKTPDCFNNVILDEWIFMPNHIHGIIVIQNFMNKRDDNNKGGNDSNKGMNAPWRVPTGLQPLNKNSLSSIINHYKGNVKRWCNKNGYEYFSWQSRFYDHIIRNEKSLFNIREYIINNPLNWDIDNVNDSVHRVDTRHGAFPLFPQDI